MGALPTLYAATQDIPGNSYVGPDGFQEQRGHPTLVGRNGAAKDTETAKRLWTLSEELTGVIVRAHAGRRLTPLCKHGERDRHAPRQRLARAGDRGRR